MIVEGQESQKTWRTREKKNDFTVIKRTFLLKNSFEFHEIPKKYKL